MSVTAARGFEASGVHAGIRRSGRDLALVRSVVPAVGGAVWTTNQVLAAPVVVSKRHLEAAEPQAVVVNAGVANAATGTAGLADAERTSQEAADQLGLDAEQVLVLSTGVIGVPLPIEKVLAGLREAATSLDANGGADAAEAILTTDRGPKQSVASCDGFVVGAMAKGAGMIRSTPGDDARGRHDRLSARPGRARPRSSALQLTQASTGYPSTESARTNDAVVLLANGASDVTRNQGRDADFAAALEGVCAASARKIVEDGEGATGPPSRSALWEPHPTTKRSQSRAG